MSEREVEEIKSRANIVDLVSGRVQLRKAGRNYSGLCPFHREKTPSFTVSEERQSFKCFGCGASGDIFEFLMRSDGLSFREALQQLAEQYSVSLKRGSGQSRQQHRGLYEVMNKAQGCFRLWMDKPEARPARALLDERGIDSKTAEHFGLGYAPHGRRLLEELGESSKPLLLSAGLIRQSERQRSASRRPAASDSDDKPEKSDREDQLYDFFRHRLMFPVHDQRGRILAFGGRYLGKDGQAPKYLNSPETPIFSKRQVVYGLHQAMQAGIPDSIVVVEGYMDVIAMAQYGWRNAVAVMGTALSREMAVKLFRQARHKRVVLCLDGDAAGQRAARSAVLEIAPTMEPGKELQLAFMPAGEDPDSLLRKSGKSALADCLGEALPLSEYLCAQIGAEGTVEQKSAALVDIVRIIGAMPETPYRVMVSKAVSEHCDMTPEQLMAGSNRRRRQSHAAAPRTSRRGTADMDRDMGRDMGSAPSPDLAEQQAMAAAADDFAAEQQTPTSAAERRAATQERRGRAKEQETVRYLLSLLLAHPQAVAEIHIPDEIANAEREQQLSSGALLCTQLIAILQSLSAGSPPTDPNELLNLLTGRLATSRHWPGNWERRLGQAARWAYDLPAMTEDERDRHMSQSLRVLAECYSPDPLRTAVRSLHQGKLGVRAKQELLLDLERRQISLSADEHMPAEMAQALTELRAVRKANPNRRR